MVLFLLSFSLLNSRSSTRGYPRLEITSPLESLVLDSPGDVIIHNPEKVSFLFILYPLPEHSLILYFPFSILVF